jgi:lincosamide nucleotidyltransferase A/C/D/E
MPAMELEQVVTLIRSFEAADLSFWLDGGWGVDALLGEQTRAHSDLDLAVRYNDLPSFQQVLEAQGYAHARRLEGTNWNLVCQHSSGPSVDLHGFILDEQRNGVLGDPANGDKYPAGSLDGIGTLGCFTVRCVAAQFVLNFRNSFDPRAVDHHDVEALCTRFSLALPSRFQTIEGQ